MVVYAATGTMQYRGISRWLSLILRETPFCCGTRFKTQVKGQRRAKERQREGGGWLLYMSVSVPARVVLVLKLSLPRYDILAEPAMQIGQPPFIHCPCSGSCFCQPAGSVNYAAFT